MKKLRLYRLALMVESKAARPGAIGLAAANSLSGRTRLNQIISSGRKLTRSPLSVVIWKPLIYSPFLPGMTCTLVVGSGHIVTTPVAWMRSMNQKALPHVESDASVWYSRSAEVHQRFGLSNRSCAGSVRSTGVARPSLSTVTTCIGADDTASERRWMARNTGDEVWKYSPYFSGDISTPGVAPKRWA